MAAGLGLLRLPPAHFWSMTPRELASAVNWHHGVTGAAAPPSRTTLAALTNRFPDT